MFEAQHSLISSPTSATPKTNHPLDLNTGTFPTYKSQTPILLFYKQVSYLVTCPILATTGPTVMTYSLNSFSASMCLFLTPTTARSSQLATPDMRLMSTSSAPPALPNPSLVLLYSWWVWLTNIAKLEKVFKLENWALIQLSPSCIPFTPNP